MLSRSCGNVSADTVTGSCYDTYLEVDLAAGDYTVTVMQYSNFANGPNLSDGFEGSGEVDFDGRNSFWAFDILNADTSAGPPVVSPGGSVQQVPTLSQWAMILLVMLVGLFGSVAAMRRRQGIVS